MTRGTIAFCCMPALLLTIGALVVHRTEDDSVIRLLATSGGGVAISAALLALLSLAARAARRGPVLREGAARPGSPMAWLVLSTIGVVLASIGATLTLRETAFDQRAETVDARVVDVQVTGVGQQRSRRGTVAFTTIDGEAVEAELDPLPTDVDDLRVRYDARDPQVVRSTLRRTQHAAPLMLLLVGVVVAAGSLVGALRRGLLARARNR